MFSENVELQAIQEKCLGIFQALQKVCNDNNLRYFITGGTLLGCIRHKGFIPWDDDMDIAMPRDDYEKLIRIANNQLPEYYRLNHYSYCINDDVPLTHHVQIVDTRTHLIKNWTLTQRKISTWIDIFPLDGLPANSVKRKLHIMHGRFWWFIMQIMWFKENVNVKKERPFLQKRAIAFLIHMPSASNKTILQVMNRFDKTARKYAFESSNWIYSFHGTYRAKELLKRIWYENRVELPFEGIPCNVPVEYDKILKHYYGHYEEVRVEQNKHTSIVVKV